MEQQELALLWAIQRLAALQTGPQLESSLVGLTTSAERSQLERLPVLMMGLGEVVKRDRSMMWAYAALKHSMVRRLVLGGGGREGTRVVVLFLVRDLDALSVSADR
jgi:hypothetical protein